MKCDLCEESGEERKLSNTSMLLCQHHYDLMKKAEDTSDRFLRLISRKFRVADNAQRKKARYITGKFIKAGLIQKKPCEKCGNPNVQVHHLDYFNPSLVQFLCEKHHRDYHKQHK